MSRSSRADCVVGSAGAIGPAGVHGSADVSDAVRAVGGVSAGCAADRDPRGVDGLPAGTIAVSWMFGMSVLLSVCMSCAGACGSVFVAAGHDGKATMAPATVHPPAGIRRRMPAVRRRREIET